MSRRSPPPRPLPARAAGSRQAQRGRTKAPRGRRPPHRAVPPSPADGTAAEPPRAPRSRRFLTGGAAPGVREPPGFGGRRLFGGCRDKEPQPPHTPGPRSAPLRPGGSPPPPRRAHLCLRPPAERRARRGSSNFSLSDSPPPAAPGPGPATPPRPLGGGPRPPPPRRPDPLPTDNGAGHSPGRRRSAPPARRARAWAA